MSFRSSIIGLVLGVGLALGISLPALAVDYNVPPDVGGDLDGTAADDTFTIGGTGTVTGSVNGLGGDDTINNSGNVGVDLNGGIGTNRITNSGTVVQDIIGSDNQAAGSSSNGSTIDNTATGDVDFIIGSHNFGVGSSAHNNLITNSGVAQGGIYGSYNEGVGSSGGGHRITNAGTVDFDLIGSVNEGVGSSGGGNTVINNHAVGGDIYGSANDWTNTSGGDNTIINNGIAIGVIYGSFNAGDGSGGSSGGGNTITNNGGVIAMVGSWNGGDDSSGGFNIITNNDLNFMDIYGSANLGVNSSGGSNIINNSGTMYGDIVGSINDGPGSGGGSNSITNSGSLGFILGSANTANNAQGGGNSITNSGTVDVDIYGSYNEGDGSGGGSNTIINSGTVGLAMVGSLNLGDGSSGGGNTIINSGTVNEHIYGSYNEGAGSSGGGNSITNSGTVKGNIYGSQDVGQGSSSAGNIITNSGRVDGSIYAGNGDDTVIIQGGSSVRGDVDGQKGDDSLRFEGAGSQSPEQYVNFEHLSFGGSGTTILNGDWDFSGDNTSIDSGTMIVAGSLTTGSLTNRGTLGGGGAIHAPVTNYGTISPGNSIGTLTIDGSVTFEPGSILAAEIDSGGSCDLLKVTGSATINSGAAISTTLPRALYSEGFSWQVLSAAGGVAGNFERVDAQTGSQVLSLAAVKTGNVISLEVWRKSYGDFGQTPNQRSVGRGLDAVAILALSKGDDMAALLTSMDWDYSASQIQGVLAACNPEMYTAFTAASLQAGGLFDRALGRRLEQRRQRLALGPDQDQAAGKTGKPGWSVWSRGLGLWADQDAGGGYLGRGQTTGGVVVGADHAVRDWLRLGLAAGATRSDLNWSQGGYGGDQEAVHTGLYAQAGTGAAFVRLVASYARLRASASRAIDFSAASTQADSGFDSDLFGAGLAMGYDLRANGWLIEPVAGLDYQHLHGEGFSESGAGYLNLDVDSRDQDSLLSRAGVRVSRLLTAGTWDLLPRVGLAWLHQLGDDRPDLSASFTGYGAAPFTVEGAEFPADQAVLEAGISASAWEGFSFFADYRLARADDYHSQSLSAGLRVSF